MTTATAHDRIAMAVIDKWLRYRIDHSDIPGAQICIRKGGEILLSAAYGKANIATGEEFTTRHLCRIASQSKTFTACAIQLLALDGRLRLDQAMIDFLPKLKTHSDARVAAVTIRDLLSNRSGLFRDGLDAGYWSISASAPDREQLIADVLAMDLIFKPNAKTKYCNWGFSLLGLIVEQASGQSYTDFVQERIIVKLPGAAIATDYAKTITLPFAMGHSRQDDAGKRVPLRHNPLGGMAPGGGFCANAEDTSLFFHTLFFTDSLLPQSVRRELLELNWPFANSKTERYGLGVQIDQMDDFHFVGHSGGLQGFSSNSRNWTGTDYVISFILNTFEKSIFPMKSAIEIIDKVTKTFSEQDIETAIVSEPMLNLFTSDIYVVSGEKALVFNADSWTPCAGKPTYTRQSSGGYVAADMHGMGNLGEVTSFNYNPLRQIVSVQDGGVKLHAEAEYNRLFANAVA